MGDIGVTKKFTNKKGSYAPLLCTVHGCKNRINRRLNLKIISRKDSFYRRHMSFSCSNNVSDSNKASDTVLGKVSDKDEEVDMEVGKVLDMV